MMDRRLQGQTVECVWMKTQEGWLTVNTDVAIFSDGSIGVGAVIETQMEYMSQML